MNYKIIYINLSNKVDQFSIRERMLLLITSICLLFLLWKALILEQINDIKDKVSNNMSKMQQQIASFQGQINQVATTLSLDPIVRLEEQIKKLYKENEELKNKLFNIKEKLISPPQMMLVLKKILDNKNLEVVSLKNLPFTPILSTLEEKEQDDEVKDESNLVFKVYKHGVEIVFKGSFFQIRDFLNEAENLPYKLLWEELEFSIIEYPLANVKIIIGALSINTALIGNEI